MTVLKANNQLSFSSSKKPVLIYVDDDKNNLIVLEASLPEHWEIHTFDKAADAIDKLGTINPWVVLSDQRMPAMSGVEFLEKVGEINENIIKIVVTGYSDEQAIIESVRKARIFDYIRKPWDPDDLEIRLQKAFDHYTVLREKHTYIEEIKARDKELSQKNKELEQKAKELKRSGELEEAARKELECWVHPNLLEALNDSQIQFPYKQNLYVVAFDIVQSSHLHGVNIQGRSIRSIIIQLFTECVVRNGGWRESHSGDSAFAHFGMFNRHETPAESMLISVQEFKFKLSQLLEENNLNIGCGIAVHYAKNCEVAIHKVFLNTPKGIFIQKSFDTSSIDIDIVHKIEKYAHQLEGINIVVSGDFLEQYKKSDVDAQSLGTIVYPFRESPVALYLVENESHVKKEDVEALRHYIKNGKKAA